LGNVRVVVSDSKQATYLSSSLGLLLKAQLRSYSDYYPFGMIEPGSSWQTGVSYRYGFNGKEKDGEFANNYDYGFRIYNANIAKFLSMDPLFKSYPWNSSYAFAENDVIRSIDLDGLEKLALSGDAMPRKGTAYNSEQAFYFKEQGTRLAQKYGFTGTVVKTGKDIIDALQKETKLKKFISFFAYFGHAGSGAFYLTSNKGFYAERSYFTSPAADMDALKEAVANKSIIFSEKSIIFLDGCNCGNTAMSAMNNERNMAIELAIVTGATVYAAAGHSEMVNTKSADGRFTVPESGGSFIMFKRVPNMVDGEVDNPDKKYLFQFWLPDKIKVKVQDSKEPWTIKETNLEREISIDTIINQQSNEQKKEDK
jgi:RHS repeat-associated protein